MILFPVQAVWFAGRASYMRIGCGTRLQAKPRICIFRFPTSRPRLFVLDILEGLLISNGGAIGKDGNVNGMAHSIIRPYDNHGNDAMEVATKI